jgi:hypothetical protein
MDASSIILLYRYYLFGMPYDQLTPSPHTYKTSSYCHSFQCDNLQCSRMELAHLTECQSLQ